MTPSANTGGSYTRTFSMVCPPTFETPLKCMFLDIAELRSLLEQTTFAFAFNHAPRLVCPMPCRGLNCRHAPCERRCCLPFAHPPLLHRNPSLHLCYPCWTEFMLLQEPAAFGRITRERFPETEQRPVVLPASEPLMLLLLPTSLTVPMGQHALAAVADCLVVLRLPRMPA